MNEHRCKIGLLLWADIDDALNTHNLNKIYKTLCAYFAHKNGGIVIEGQRTEPCRECGGHRMKQASFEQEEA